MVAWLGHSLQTVLERPTRLDRCTGWITRRSGSLTQSTCCLLLSLHGRGLTLHKEMVLCRNTGVMAGTSGGEAMS